MSLVIFFKVLFIIWGNGNLDALTIGEDFLDSIAKNNNLGHSNEIIDSTIHKTQLEPNPENPFSRTPASDTTGIGLVKRDIQDNPDINPQIIKPVCDELCNEAYFTLYKTANVKSMEEIMSLEKYDSTRINGVLDYLKNNPNSDNDILRQKLELYSKLLHRHNNIVDDLSKDGITKDFRAQIVRDFSYKKFITMRTHISDEIGAMHGKHKPVSISSLLN